MITLTRYQSLLVTTAMLISSSICATEKPVQPPVVIDMSVSPTTVEVGETFTIIEAVRTNPPPVFSIGSYYHRVLKIGEYDRDRCCLRMNDSTAYETMSSFGDGYGPLANVTTFSHGMTYDFVNASGSGIRLRSEATEPGIYLITATWHPRGGGNGIGSSPVVLVVKPAKPAAGKK